MGVSPFTDVYGSLQALNACDALLPFRGRWRRGPGRAS